jgi:circadian clock protein KaiB
MSQDDLSEREPVDRSAEFERLLEEEKHAQFVLRLYVTGLTARSTRAINTVNDLCEQELKGRYELEVIDVSKRPDLAKEENVIAAPMLVKKLPLPLRRLIGDLSDKERVLVGLDLRPRE